MAISLSGTLLTSGGLGPGWGWSRLSRATLSLLCRPENCTIGYQTRAERGARDPGQSSIRPCFLPHMGPLPVSPSTLHSCGPARRLHTGGGEGAL